MITMKHKFTILIITVFCTAVVFLPCFGQQPTVPVVTFEQFMAHVEKNKTKIHVVNFWATWCKPCVQELPNFIRLQREYASKNVVITFVSLDFKKDYDKLLVPFVKKRKMTNVLLLDAPNPNSWIDRVSKDWSGAIPGTLVVPPASSGKTQVFHEGEIEYVQLEKLVQPFLR